jgi:hypothetical protein
MSLPQFDPDVTLDGVTPPGSLGLGANSTFVVKGSLRPDQQSQELRVFVSVWQTEEDTIGGEATKIVARALGEGGQDSDPAKWFARMTMQNRTQFTPGRPATGLALTVEASDDPGAFETYTWTERLTIKAP